MSLSCPDCGATIRPQAQFCNVCGASMPSQPAPMTVNPSPAQLIPMGSGMVGAKIFFADGASLPLQPVTTIGRDQSQCNLPFPNDDRLSRVHARLEERGGSWLLTDLNSSNGTFVNGTRIAQPVVVQPHDQIEVGSAVFSLRLPGGGALAPTALFSGDALGAPGAAHAAMQAPQGGWRTWQVEPLVQGYVEHKSERYMMKKDDLWQRGCLAVALGILFAPLALLPFIQGSEVPVYDLRVQDARSGQLVDVKIVGELMGNINLGDPVAIWCKKHRGVLAVQRAHNYVSGAKMGVKKV